MLKRIEGETGAPVAGEGVYFQMRSGRRTVRFFATSGLLAALARGEAIDGRESFERDAFRAFRREIEALAAERYARRPFDDDSIIWISEHALAAASCASRPCPPRLEPRLV